VIGIRPNKASHSPKITLKRIQTSELETAEWPRRRGWECCIRYQR